MKSLNEIKALVKTYQGFSLLYFAKKTISIMREWKKFTINKRGEIKWIFDNIIELMMTARQKESSPMEVQTS